MKLVAVSSCPTGIAHTYMAAEALEQAGKAAGHEVHVETQGAAGSTPLDPAMALAGLNFRGMLSSTIIACATEPGVPCGIGSFTRNTDTRSASS